MSLSPSPLLKCPPVKCQCVFVVNSVGFWICIWSNYSQLQSNYNINWAFSFCEDALEILLRNCGGPQTDAWWRLMESPRMICYFVPGRFLLQACSLLTGQGTSAGLGSTDLCVLTPSLHRVLLIIVPGCRKKRRCLMMNIHSKDSWTENLKCPTDNQEAVEANFKGTLFLLWAKRIKKRKLWTESKFIWRFHNCQT